MGKTSEIRGCFPERYFSGMENKNNFRALLVRIEPNRAMGIHAHEGMYELHEIIEGDGEASIDNSTVKYAPGLSHLFHQTLCTELLQRIGYHFIC